MVIPKKKKKNSEKKRAQKFVVRIDQQIFEAVDQVLEIAEKGKIRDAERLSSELLKQHPDVHYVQYAMGVICTLKEQYDESIVYFNKALEIHPYFVEAWFNKGNAHQKRLEVDEMLIAFRKVTELGDPAEEYVQHARTVIRELDQQIRKDKGVSLDTYLKGGSKYKEAFAAMEKQEWEKALHGFQAVLAIDPEHTQSYGNIGICYAYLGRKQEALAALDKALELDPGYHPAISNRQIISSLDEQELLSDRAKFETIDYYKGSAEKKKSLFNRLFGRFWS